MVSQAPRENVAPQDHKDPKEEMEIKDQWVHPVQLDLNRTHWTHGTARPPRRLRS